MAVTSTVETITKELAQELLESQDVNRPISWTTVRRYQNDMNAGRWSLNGEAIKIDRNGHMRDGAHRCHAVIGASVNSFTTLVVRGVEPESQRSMDQGRKRTPGNQLAMAGVKDANLVGAGVRLYLAYTSGIIFRDRKLIQEFITTVAIEEWCAANLAAVEALHAYVSDIKGSDAPASVAYAAALIFNECSPESAPKFFRLLSKGAGGEEHPITVLDKRLQRHRREGIKISSRDVLGLYIQAWNAWMKGRPLTRFQRPRGGSWTEATFPRPVAPDRRLFSAS